MLIFEVVCTTLLAIASALSAGCASDTEGGNPAGATALAVVCGLAALIIGSHL